MRPLRPCLLRSESLSNCGMRFRSAVALYPLANIRYVGSRDRSVLAHCATGVISARREYLGVCSRPVNESKYPVSGSTRREVRRIL
jgi:hypothetical protein